MGLAHVITSIAKSVTGMFQMVELHDFKEIPASEIKKLKVSTASTGVILVPEDQENITIELKGQVSKRLEDAFALGVKKANNNTLDVSVTRKASPIIIGFVMNRSKLYVTVPKKWYEAIDIQTTSGSIEGKELTAGTISMHASSGNVKVRKLEATNELNIEASSGSVQANNLQSPTTISLQTSSGSVRANDIQSNRLWMKANSGSLDVRNLSGKEISLVTSSGSIHARDIDGELKAEAASGSIKVSNSDIKGQWALKAKSGSVNVQLEQPESLEVKFIGKSGSGKVNLEGFDYEIKAPHSFLGHLGTGENKLNVRTNSGRFRLS